MRLRLAASAIVVGTGLIGREIFTAMTCTWSNGTTPMGPDHLTYEVTIEDPKVFTQPWKMAMTLYRRKEPHIQLLEYECAEYVFEEESLKGGQVPPIQ